MKRIHEISRAVASLEEQPSGKLVAGFTVLAPKQLSAYFGGASFSNLLPCGPQGNVNCAGINCVQGCGPDKDPKSIT